MNAYIGLYQCNFTMETVIFSKFCGQLPIAKRHRA